MAEGTRAGSGESIIRRRMKRHGAPAVGSESMHNRQPGPGMHSQDIDTSTDWTVVAGDSGRERMDTKRAPPQDNMAKDATGREPRRLRIGLMHRIDVRDIRAWSGIFHFMGQSLQKHVGDVVCLGPDHSFLSKLLSHIRWRINKAAAPLLGKTILWDENRITSRRIGYYFSKLLKESPVDVIVAPVASLEIAYLNTKVPIVYLSDLTWHNIVDYYPGNSNLSSFARREGENIEARAIRRADAVVYPSSWPCRTALEHYQADPEKVYEIPFGANLVEVPDRVQACTRTLGQTIELLWVGVDWHRKGGDIAVECLRELRRRGHSACLTVCGCVPPAELSSDPDIRMMGFLDKSDPVQRQKLTDLYRESHFFLFPTRAEAYGIVVAEASAHGLPCLAADTGGVSGVLLDRRNGFLMPRDANGKKYAETIMAIVEDPPAYEALVRSSREAFEQHLNWDSWADAMRSVIQEAIKRRTNKSTECAPPGGSCL